MSCDTLPALYWLGWLVAFAALGPKLELADLSTPPPPYLFRMPDITQPPPPLPWWIRGCLSPCTVGSDQGPLLDTAYNVAYSTAPVLATTVGLQCIVRPEDFGLEAGFASLNLGDSNSPGTDSSVSALQEETETTFRTKKQWFVRYEEIPRVKQRAPLVVHEPSPPITPLPKRPRLNRKRPRRLQNDN